MQFMALIYGDESIEAQQSEAEQAAVYKEYNEFGSYAEGRKAMVTGEAFLPTSSATTVRVRNGKRLTSDGPVNASKIQLGGFYILECKDIGEAVEIASHIPGVRTGSVEVRPVVVFE